MHRQTEAVTRDYLIELLTPLIGQRDDRNARRGLHLTANISFGGHRRVDADICAISEKGITDCHFDMLRTIAWEDVREVQVILRDGLGEIQMEGAVLALDHRPARAAA